MVCPNCHSDQVIEVQDQHFCINCGQIVPDSPGKKAPAKVGVQVDGLPDGVKIISPNGAAPDLEATAKSSAPADPVTKDPETTTPAPAEPNPASEPTASFIKPRSRTRSKSEDPDTEAKNKRKPGRPKAGRLDLPRPITLTAPAPTLPDAPKIAPAGPPEPAPTPSSDKSKNPSDEPSPQAPAPSGSPVRSMNDIAPRKAPVPAPSPEATPASVGTAAATALTALRTPKRKTKKSGFSFGGLFKPKAKHHADTHTPNHTANHAVRPPHHQVHKVGVPPLHYGSVVKFSLRARIQPRLFALATLASLSFAAVTAYAVWLLLNDNLSSLASSLSHNLSHQLVVELVIFTALYYIGRNIGQSAITFGVIRDVDQRPVSLSRQLGVGINTFGRHLRLDTLFTLSELILISLAAGLMLVGGEAWQVSAQLQVTALFSAFLVLLYLMTAVTLSHGLGSVALTITNLPVVASTKLGWKLFSHRFELLGLRFAAIAIELLLALPLIALAAVFIIKAPHGLHLLVTIAVGFLALFTGSLFGAGTASWWAALYRRIVQVDQPDHVSTLLSGQKSHEPNSGDLAFIVALSSFLVAAAAATPWLRLP